LILQKEDFSDLTHFSTSLQYMLLPFTTLSSVNSVIMRQTVSLKTSQRSAALSGVEHSSGVAYGRSIRLMQWPNQMANFSQKELIRYDTI